MKNTITLIGVLIVLAIPSFAAEPPQKLGTLQVQVMVFSGRPDPVFVISDPAIIKQVTEILSSLPSHPTLIGDGGRASPGRLGYRGMLVENPFRGGSDITSFTVYRTAIEVAYDGKKPKEFRLDAGAKLEQLLIGMAEKKNIFSSGVLDHIKGGK